jgi:hypothetical protein
LTPNFEPQRPGDIAALERGPRGVDRAIFPNFGDLLGRRGGAIGGVADFFQPLVLVLLRVFRPLSTTAHVVTTAHFSIDSLPPLYGSISKCAVVRCALWFADQLELAPF